MVRRLNICELFWCETGEMITAGVNLYANLYQY